MPKGVIDARLGPRAAAMIAVIHDRANDRLRPILMKRYTQSPRGRHGRDGSRSLV
jgi:hypothetical protein